MDDQGGVGHLIGALGEAGVQRLGQLAGQGGEQLLQLRGGLGLGGNGVAAAEGGLQPGDAAAQKPCSRPWDQASADRDAASS